MLLFPVSVSKKLDVGTLEQMAVLLLSVSIFKKLAVGTLEQMAWLKTAAVWESVRFMSRIVEDLPIALCLVSISKECVVGTLLWVCAVGTLLWDSVRFMSRIIDGLVVLFPPLSKSKTIAGGTLSQAILLCLVSISKTCAVKSLLWESVRFMSRIIDGLAVLFSPVSISKTIAVGTLSQEHCFEVACNVLSLLLLLE